MENLVRTEDVQDGRIQYNLQGGNKVKCNLPRGEKQLKDDEQDQNWIPIRACCSFLLKHNISLSSVQCWSLSGCVNVHMEVAWGQAGWGAGGGCQIPEPAVRCRANWLPF